MDEQYKLLKTNKIESTFGNWKVGEENSPVQDGSDIGFVSNIRFGKFFDKVVLSHSNILLIKKTTDDLQEQKTPRLIDREFCLL